jgi:hypothetical protein
MSTLRATRLAIVAGLFLFLSLVATRPSAQAGFHLWQVKEVFSNADGSVQFIEMFDSFSPEQFLTNQLIQADSTVGAVTTTKYFTFDHDLDTTNHSTVDRHTLIATPGFGSLSGGVAPDYFLNPAADGVLFNPNADSITITFLGSGDSITFSGASLPKDGIHSLTDSGAVGFPPGSPNISSTVNSPTNFENGSGSVNLGGSTSPDYNGNHAADLADYPTWRKNPSGFGGNPAGYVNWRSNFGNAVPADALSGALVPEPTAIGGILMGIGLLAMRRRTRRPPPD